MFVVETRRHSTVLSRSYSVLLFFLWRIFRYSFFFFFNDTATTEIYTLSLHDALPIWPGGAGAGDRDVLDVVQRLDPVLRGLGREVVVDPVLPVQEEGRRGLEAAAQGDEQAAGEVPRGESGLSRLRAVDGDVELRVVEALMDAEVDQPAHLTELVQHLVGGPPIALDVGPLDLDVDRRRQPEVDDLRHDVGGQEIERHAGEFLRQLLSEGPDVVRGRSMVGLQGDEDVRVGGADDAGRAVHPVDAAVRHPDVVDDHVHLAGGDLMPDRLVPDGGPH